MLVSARHSSPAFELDWSLDRAAPPAAEGNLTLEYSLRALEELYVADRLWLYDQNAARVAESQGVYRFVASGSLRLVFDQAPPPPNLRLQVLFTPLYSRVEAGATHRRRVSLALPVAEYSALAADMSAPTRPETVERVTLVMAYRLRATMEKEPQPPPKESAERAGYIVHGPERLISTVQASIPVVVRTGAIARYRLPNNPD